MTQVIIRITKIIAVLVFSVIAQFSKGQTTFNYKMDFQKILSRTKNPDDKLAYNKLLKRFYINDSTLTDFEVLALLIGFTDKVDYKPYDDLVIEREIYKLNAEKKYQEGLNLSNMFLKTHPLSVKALFEKSYSFYKLKQNDSAQFYMDRGRSIFRAMRFSGDGKSIGTAIFSLGPADGQDYIYKVVAAKIGVMGSGTDKDGNFLDILEVLPKEGGSSYRLYFVIQHATEKMFDGKSIEEELKEKKKK